MWPGSPIAHACQRNLIGAQNALPAFYFNIIRLKRWGGKSAHATGDPVCDWATSAGTPKDIVVRLLAQLEDQQYLTVENDTVIIYKELPRKWNSPVSIDTQVLSSDVSAA